MCLTQKEKPLVTKEVSTLLVPTCPLHPEEKLIYGYGNDQPEVCVKCEQEVRKK